MCVYVREKRVSVRARECVNESVDIRKQSYRGTVAYTSSHKEGEEFFITSSVMMVNSVVEPTSQSCCPTVSVQN